MGPTLDFNSIGNKSRVPHISLVFREMWDATALNHKAFGSLSTLKVWTCGIPHLAKNERDVGHPALVCLLETRNSTLKQNCHLDRSEA
jgi:hypothetical protein